MNKKKILEPQKIKTMETTKVVSFRIPYGIYERILLACEEKDITISEYIERKMATAESVEELKNDIALKVEDAYNYIDSYPVFTKARLAMLLKELSH